MRPSLLSIVLAGAGSASAAAVPTASLAPALPLDQFKTTPFHGQTLEELLARPVLPVSPKPSEAPQEFRVMTAAASASCSNPRVRVEWDNLSNNDRMAFINAVKCLMGKPRSGQFSNSQNRYEDFVALHQQLTPNVHDNSKFLVWHRYYIWAFEDELKSVCGYSGNLPWFDESRYSGRFSQSSIFSSQYFGGIAIGGNCVTDGVSSNSSAWFNNLLTITAGLRQPRLERWPWNWQHASLSRAQW
jgi:tyrosinase